MRRDVHVDDAASVVQQHDEHKQHAKRRGGNREEVDGGAVDTRRGPQRVGRVHLPDERLDVGGDCRPACSSRA
jgi:hypothetical protein